MRNSATRRRESVVAVDLLTGADPPEVLLGTQPVSAAIDIAERLGKDRTRSAARG